MLSSHNNDFISDIENSIHYSLLDNNLMNNDYANTKFYHYLILCTFLFVLIAVIIYICFTTFV